MFTRSLFVESVMIQCEVSSYMWMLLGVHEVMGKKMKEGDTIYLEVGIVGDCKTVRRDFSEL